MPASAQQFLNADGTRTNDLEAAASSWRNDREFKAGGGLDAINAEYAYAMGFSGNGVKVGIFDTGVYGKHPEFAGDGKLTGLHTEGTYAYTYGNYYKKGDPFSFNGDDPLHGIGLHPDTHGTHVAGIIGANRDGKGMHGVAFGANLIAAITGDPGLEDGVVAGNDANTYKAGFDALIKSGVRIINNSWGIGFLLPSPVQKPGVISQYLSAPNDGTMNAAASVARAGILYVKSAGNKYGSEPDALGALPYFKPDIEKLWVTVANLQSFGPDAKLSGSSSICGMAKFYCISAPGTNINSSVYEGDADNNKPGYGKKSGTSMAAPYVSGALAVLMERYPYLTNEQVRDVMLTTALSLNKTALGVPDEKFGWGQLDLKKAMFGPGQFLGQFEANLWAGAGDMWTNDISDVAIRARQIEDEAEHREWEATKIAKGWQNGPPLDASEADKAEYAFRTARDEAYKTRQYNGGLTKLGGGALWLAGQNTYSGATIVNAGLLGIDVKGSILSATTINDTGMMVVDGKAASVDVNKGGKLKVSVGGSSDDVLLNGGFASIDGTSGNTVVNKDGVLAGIGRIASLMANDGALIGPGNSIGTLTVSHDATFNKGSTLAIEVTADGRNDKLVVEGKANLNGGTVAVSMENDKALLSVGQLYALLNKVYTIVEGKGGVTGVFDKVMPNYYFIGATLGYGADTVDLKLARNNVAFADVGQTFNQKSVAANIEGLGLGNLLYDTIAISKDGDGLPTSLTMLSGDLHASLKGVLAEDDHFVRDAVSSRLGQALDQARTSMAWAQAYGSWSNKDSDGNAIGRSRSIGGFAGGFDGMLADRWRLGFLLGHANTSLSGGGSSAKADSYQFGLYGGTNLNAFSLGLGTSFSYHRIDTKRQIVVGNLKERELGNYDAYGAQAFGEAGYRFATPYASFQPFAGLAYSSLRTTGFRERGGISALSAHSDSTGLASTTLGVRLSHDFIASIGSGDGLPISMRGMAAWRHGFGDVGTKARLAFAGGTDFLVRGLPIAEDTAVVEASISANLTKATSIGVAYNGQFAEQTQDHSVKGNLAVRF